MKINIKQYKIKYSRCLKQVTIKRLKELKTANRAHLRKCARTPNDQTILTEEILMIEQELNKRKDAKKLKQVTLT